MKPSLLIQHEPGPIGGHTLHALLTLEGDPPPALDRVPLNLALVLDRSGSMAGSKLAAVKEAAVGLVRRLHPDDRVSVVAFDDTVSVIADGSQPGDAVDLEARIRAIPVGGMTNLSGGWLQGRQLVEHARSEGSVNRVILLTDGLANQGITKPEQLVALTATAHSQSVTTTTIGVGGGYDEDLLDAMADGGSGSSYYIEEPDQAVGIFEEEMLGLLSLSAQNVTVHLVPGPGAALTTVHHTYPSQTEDQRLTLRLGDLYAREPRKLLMQFQVEDGSETVHVATLAIEADVVTSEGGMEHRRIELGVRFDPADGPHVEPEIGTMLLLMEAAAARRTAVERGEEGDLDGAVRSVREAAAHLREADAAAYGPMPQAEADDLEGLADTLEEQGHWAERDRKYAKRGASSIQRARMAPMDRVRRKKS